MNINSATAFRHIDQLTDAIRAEALQFKRTRINISQVRPGDMVASTGQVIRQVFDFVHDPRTEGTDPMNLHRNAPRNDDGQKVMAILVQFSQVTGLSVLQGDCTGLSPTRLDCIEIFRPVQPEDKVS